MKLELLKEYKNIPIAEGYILLDLNWYGPRRQQYQYMSFKSVWKKIHEHMHSPPPPLHLSS
jgi:hypothetical protein